MKVMLQIMIQIYCYSAQGIISCMCWSTCSYCVRKTHCSASKKQKKTKKKTQENKTVQVSILNDCLFEGSSQVVHSSRGQLVRDRPSKLAQSDSSQARIYPSHLLTFSLQSVPSFFRYFIFRVGFTYFASPHHKALQCFCCYRIPSLLGVADDCW